MVCFVTAHGALRVKRQEEVTTKKEESFEAELCKDKDAGEWFRLVAGEGDACRDVIQCTSSVSQHIYIILYSIRKRQIVRFSLRWVILDDSKINLMT